MSDCTNETMRDLLPLLAHDALDAAGGAGARAHIATCASCASELALLTAARTVFAAATPAVDHAAILARINAPVRNSLGTPTAARPTLTVTRGSSGIFGMPRYALAAAASLVLVAALSLAVIRPTFFGVPTAGPDVDVVAAAKPAGNGTAVPMEMLGAGTLDDLDVDELTLFLAELDVMEATIGAEPLTMRESLVTSPEEGI